ncbi:UNVERIFIED_CONTAM: hypothetical protein PYX00_010709 [Menopon gallinae]|uniref:Gastrin/cholecystokinin type B receptor n=1 Tax=Menopon gallinae TaxID=328185 RepID=A0AAW2HGB8_9NEOP
MNVSDYRTGNLTEAFAEGSFGFFGTLWDNGKWEIPLYSAIFLLSIVGNILVILTLGKNTRMRTVTNVFLLNLAASDLVLTVLCMPFTLIGTLLRDFIFGNWMCKLVPFLQATSVAASVWTLVALSVERYYAICHPLRSRKWQTQSHARRLIASIWIGGSSAMLPVLVLSELQPTKKGRNKCRENWPGGCYEKAYNLFLDMLLLVVPLLALLTTYYLIAATLWKDLKKKEKVLPPLSGEYAKQGRPVQQHCSGCGRATFQ